MKFTLWGGSVGGVLYEADSLPMWARMREGTGYGRERNWPPDQTRSRKARAVAKLRKERR
jgi:hypothetical protein